MASQSSESSEVIVVTCGNLQGLLHRKAFLCPGLHQECIEVNGHMTTPKMFSVMGDKERLKDWKNAVRIKGFSLRKLMESGELDFYNHQESCTGRCLSRVSKYDMKMESLQAASDGDLAMGTTSMGETSEHHHHHQCNYTLIQDSGQNSMMKPSPILSQVMYSHYNTNATHPNTVLGTISSQTASRENMLHRSHEFGHCAIKSEPDGMVNDNSDTAGGASGQTTAALHSHTTLDVAVISQEKSIDYYLGDSTNMTEDCEAFWRGIINVGLLDAFCREIKMAVDGVKHCLVKFPNAGFHDNSEKLSNIVKELGLIAKLKYRMAEHRQHTEKMDVQLLQEIEVLKKRVTDSEHKREVLKRKSECFEQLIELGHRSKKKSVLGSAPDDGDPAAGGDS